MDARGRDQRGTVALLVCAALCLGLTTAPARAVAVAEPPLDEATPMYSPNALVVIDLTLPEASIEALKEQPLEYQPGSFSLAFTDGTPAGVGEASALRKVEVRLKGIGSFQSLDGKAAFKLKFKKSDAFLGLRKMTLNNMVQDPSMTHETLSYTLFRAAGVPASRTGFAYVRVNGEDFGLYLNIENLDQIGLEKRFGPFGDFQHLYEGGYGTDVTPGAAGAFEVDEGDAEDRADLEALIEAVAGKAAPFAQRVDGLADLEEMTRMWAVERYIGHWDGYGGWEGALQPNNYYLYSDPNGEFQMFPWGTDMTWKEHLSFDGGASLLFDECIADPICEGLYRESLLAVQEAVAPLDLDALAASTASLLAPWQQLGASREVHGLGKIEERVGATREFIAQRPGELVRWLSGESQTSSSLAVPVSATERQMPLASEHPRPMMVGRPSVTDGTLVTRLELPSPGRVAQRVQIRTARGIVSACLEESQVEEPGALTLRCQLSQVVRRRLSARWLRLYVSTRFTSTPSGPTESTAHEVIARRIGPS